VPCPVSVNDLSVAGKPFPTVGARRALGRLGNHMWAVMMNYAIAVRFGLNMVMFEETKYYMKRYFKGFDQCPTLEDDLCGFSEFFEHFRTSLDKKIEQFYSEKSGREVKLQRVGNQVRNQEPILGPRVTTPAL
jgi:hypothetical protein